MSVTFSPVPPSTKAMKSTIAIAVAFALAGLPSAARAADRTFPAGSLIVPMDLSYQDTGVLQAYGLLYELLRQGVPVYWVIDPDKTYHAAPCNTPGDECAWDCAPGAGKCPYPTASPDFTASSIVVWHDRGTLAPGTAIAGHAYRGGPFVIDAADKTRALAIIDAWNDQTKWSANPWAQRAMFEVVSVHEATAAFTGNVMKEMFAAPTIAVFSDGNEDIATSYLRAAGIPQSTGVEFPAAKCGGAGTCGPGTANPDMLTVQAVMGDMGTCAAPNLNHKNGALFRPDGLPAYCQIMSMHWGVNDRETVQCGGGACPATQAQCGNQPITYHGHEVVAEVRSFLQYPVHFFAECQAVNAYENTTPNPAWPYLDDAGRDGHFLTTTGMPPPCPCTDDEFECVAGGCNGADCCLPKDIKEQGAGFMIAAQPASNTLKVLRPNVPYNQFDGAFATVGGSEPAYNLSAYLQTKYKNDRQVTLITGPNGPGLADVWMTGYLDGGCDIGPIGAPVPKSNPDCFMGKISYLGGHQFATTTPIVSGSQSQGARLFLNALFEADCVTAEGQPAITLSISPAVVGAKTVPFEVDVAAHYANTAKGAALDAALETRVPSGATALSADANGTVSAAGAKWDIGAISGVPLRPGDPPDMGTRTARLRFDAYGDYTITVALSYKVGSSTLTATRDLTVSIKPDRDGDGVPDDTDPAPDDPNSCGSNDGDNCDDCTSGTFDPDSDGCGAGGDGGTGNLGTGDKAGCCSADRGPAGPLALLLLVIALLAPRRRGRARL